MSWLRSFGWCLTRVSNEHSRKKKLRRNNGHNGINGTHGNRGEAIGCLPKPATPFFRMFRLLRCFSSQNRRRVLSKFDVDPEIDASLQTPAG
jgi:hypothetical protein